MEKISAFFNASFGKINYEYFRDAPMERRMIQLGQMAKNLRFADQLTTWNFVMFNDVPYCFRMYHFYMTLLTPRVILKISKDTEAKLHAVVLDSETSETILLINDLGMFNTNFQTFVNSSFFLNKGRYRVVFCNEIVAGEEVIHNLVRDVWAFEVLEFVLLYYDNVDFWEVQFNPFTDELIKVNIADIDENFVEFPDKLDDMNGYPLKVLDYPNLLEAQNLYYDFDWNFREALKTSLNATLIYHHMPLEESRVGKVIDWISSSDIDLCIVTQAFSRTYFPQEYARTIDFSYPYFMNDYVVLVPKPKMLRKWTHLFMSFHTSSLFAIIFVCLLIALLDKTLSLDPKRSLDINFYFFAILKVPFKRSFTDKSIIKGVWLLGALFLEMLFENGYLNMFLTNRYTGQLKTLENLNQSGLTIYFAIMNATYLNFSIPYTRVPKSKWRELLFKNEEEAAFIGTTIEVERIMKYFTNQRKELKYEILEQSAVPKVGQYVLRGRTPYLNKISEIGAIVLQFGVSGKIKNKAKHLKGSDFKITFEHFLGIFVILVCGHLAALLVFVLELCWSVMKS